MKHPVNHLGTRLERQTNYRLPLQAELMILEKFTRMVKQALEPVLPEEALQSLQVIHCDHPNLTISTSNHTLANHLNYISHAILEILHQAYPDFLPFEQLKFRVIMMNHRFTKTPSPSTTIQGNQSVKNVTSCELSDLTKQNITQLAKLVTSNKKLVQVLHNLVPPSE